MTGILSRPLWVIVCLGVISAVLALAPSAGAQDGPEKGGHEEQFWTGGGVARNVAGREISLWNAGFRYGWILTEGHGPKGLRGRFEYAVDAEPIFWFFQPGGTAFEENNWIQRVLHRPVELAGIIGT